MRLTKEEKHVLEAFDRKIFYDMTTEAIASLVGFSEERTNKLLSKLQEKKILDKGLFGWHLRIR